MTTQSFTLRLVTALLLGAVIGLERQWRQRVAGLRTNTLVATGAALFVTLTGLIGAPNANPTAIPAQIVSGIGFLAGAIIFREGLTFTGLNTAATLWGTAAVGSLAGAGRVVEAAIGTLGILCANVVLRPIARRLNRRPLGDGEAASSYDIRAVTSAANEGIVRGFVLSTLQGSALRLHSLASSDLAGGGSVEVKAIVTAPRRDDEALERILARLSLDPSVSAVSWHVADAAPELRQTEEG